MVDAPSVQPLAPRQTTCLGRTCMKWKADGELTDLDWQLILQRLMEVDAQAGGLRAEPRQASR